MSGSLDHAPSDVIQQLMVDLGLGTAPEDGAAWPVYATRRPDLPDSVITVLDTAGIHQGRHQTGGEVQERAGVQIAVRSPNPYDGWKKINDIAITLDQVAYREAVTVEDAVGTGSEIYFVHAVSRSSGPIALGKEPKTRRNLFTLNVTAVIKQLT